MRVRSLRTLSRLTPVLSMLAAPVRAEVAAPQKEPPFVVDSILAEVRGLDRIEISVQPTFHVESEDGKSPAPDPNRAWRCSLHVRGQPKRRSCPQKGWMTEGPGEYGVFVSFWRSGIKVPVVYGQSLDVSGDELRISARVLFYEMVGGGGKLFSPPEKRPSGLYEFTLQRILRAPADLVLRRDWKPSANADPRYVLENRGKLTWFDLQGTANFFGWVESFAEGTWKFYKRGGTCGTVSPGQPLAAGGKEESFEGFFIDTPKPFTPGRYRYVVQVSRDAQAAEGHPAVFSNAGAPLVRRWDTVEITDEFSIIPQRK